MALFTRTKARGRKAHCKRTNHHGAPVLSSDLDEIGADVMDSEDPEAHGHMQVLDLILEE